MRINTIESQRLPIRKDFLFSDKNQKLSFPDIYHSPIKAKIFKNKNIVSLHKNKIKNLEIKSPVIHRNKYRSKHNMKIVALLTFDDKINDILNTNHELEKQKEKIDNNNTIKMVRLGLYKKKEKEENDNIEDNKEEEFNKILDKEKENEEDLEKMESENREKEEKMEKKYREKLIDFEKIKNECQIINKKIIKINEKIADNQIDSNILVRYAEEFDKKFMKKVNQNNAEKNHDSNNKNINSGVLNENNEMNETIRKKNKQFEDLNKLIIYKQQREERKKFLKESISEKAKIKEELENDLISKKSLYFKYKKELDILRKQLINRYHLKLYEGLNFHNEGLLKIIKDIWNLGENVNINFMPTYLDKKSIDFIFKRAQHSIELIKIRQAIKENEKELISYLKEWKLNNKEINNSLNKITHTGFFNKSDEHKNTMTFTNENELFKTKISDISISYLDPYPKTKEFMIEYKKKHPQFFQRDLPDIEIKHLKFRSLNIPAKILEKNKNIEKLRYLMEMKMQQNREYDRNEVKRLTKEFIQNNYQKKYKVNIESLFGALFGDKKNEMLLYYSKLEKEYRDGIKIIQFHTKNKLNLKK